MQNPPLPPLSVIPKHIAIIMDGNNRYGKSQELPTGAGHIKGKDALDPIVEHCLARGVQVLTVFAFSSENWARPKYEVDLLMTLLAQTIHEQLPRMHQYQIRLRFIGDTSVLSDEVQRLIKHAEKQTEQFTRMTLVIAISYGGKWDITHACQTLALQVAQGKLAPEDISETLLARQVQLGDLPDVDMLVRTGGEFRLSNFLLWQSAYAELFFTPTLWPEFTPDELDAMMVKFASTQRRFGKTSEQIDSGQ